MILVVLNKFVNCECPAVADPRQASKKKGKIISKLHAALKQANSLDEAAKNKVAYT